jgi:hypothetical protein
MDWVLIQQQLPRESEDGIIWSSIWTSMPYTAQLDWVIFGPDIVDEAEAKVHRIQDNLKAANSRQESYANKRHQPLQFEVGDHVYLKVSPMKDIKRFGVKGKLSPHYIGPFLILEAGVTTNVGRNSWHLPCISAKEGLEGTHGCCITGSATAQSRFGISRTSDQYLGSKESCHKAEDD